MEKFSGAAKVKVAKSSLEIVAKAMYLSEPFSLLTKQAVETIAFTLLHGPSFHQAVMDLKKDTAAEMPTEEGLQKCVELAETYGKIHTKVRPGSLETSVQQWVEWMKAAIQQVIERPSPALLNKVQKLVAECTLYWPHDKDILESQAAIGDSLAKAGEEERRTQLWKALQAFLPVAPTDLTAALCDRLREACSTTHGLKLLYKTKVNAEGATVYDIVKKLWQRALLDIDNNDLKTAELASQLHHEFKDCDYKQLMDNMAIAVLQAIDFAKQVAALADTPAEEVVATMGSQGFVRLQAICSGAMKVNMTSTKLVYIPENEEEESPINVEVGMLMGAMKKPLAFVDELKQARVNLALRLVSNEHGALLPNSGGAKGGSKWTEGLPDKLGENPMEALIKHAKDPDRLPSCDVPSLLEQLPKTQKVLW